MYIMPKDNIARVNRTWNYTIYIFYTDINDIIDALEFDHVAICDPMRQEWIVRWHLTWMN